MADLTAGFFPNCNSGRSGYIRVFAWMAPEFGPWDCQIRRRAKLFPIRSIIVERNVDETNIGWPRIRWSDGTDIPQWERKKLHVTIRNRINAAFKESLRLAGGRKRRH